MATHLQGRSLTGTFTYKDTHLNRETHLQGHFLQTWAFGAIKQGLKPKPLPLSKPLQLGLRLVLT